MIRRLGSDITSTFHRYNASSAAIWLTLAALASVGCSNTPADSDNPANGGAIGASSNSEARGGESASSSHARASGGSDDTQSKSDAGGTSSVNSKSGAGGKSATSSSKSGTGGDAEAGAGGDSAEAGGAHASGGNTARTRGSKSSTGGTSTGPKSATGGSTGSSKTGTGGTSTSSKDSAGGSSPKSGAGGTSGVGGSSTPAAGGTSPASTSSSTGFNPCPTNGDPCKILPLGDSITYGMASGDNGGYRVPLFKKVIAANQKITFTGTVMAGPSTVSGVTFPKNNEGHSGWTIDQIAGLVPSPAFNTIPNIVLLMAGTNDVYAASGQATMQDRLGTLIDKVIKAAPDALLVVATLTPLSNASWTSTLNTYNGKIPAVIQTRASAGKHVVMVDMSKMPSSQLADGVHPNDTGYAYMADVWYAAIKDVLPK